MDEELSADEVKHVPLNGKKLSLNFADKDEKENAKFNDARLVDILRNYPLLYNKSLESYGDPDYTQWMWGEIANEMNEPHRKTTLNLPFNWTTCRDQWEVVKRALRYLSNPAAKSFRYPKQFRESLDFFQNYIREVKEPPHTDRSQDLFLQFCTSIEQLPFEKQLLLEKEVVDIILSNELEFCAPVVDPQAVETQAIEEFGRVIGLLMPEVDFRTVHNELSTEPDTELFLDAEIMQKPLNSIVTEPVSFTSQTHSVAEIKPCVTLNRDVSDYDFKDLIRIQSEPAPMEVPEMHGNVQYTMQEGTEVEDMIEEDEMQEEQINADAPLQEVVLQECIYEEDDIMQEEDLIEEVISEGGNKDMPVLEINISGSFEVPGNRLDFDGVLNEMLE